MIGIAVGQTHDLDARSAGKSPGMKRSESQRPFPATRAGEDLESPPGALEVPRAALAPIRHSVRDADEDALETRFPAEGIDQHWQEDFGSHMARVGEYDDGSRRVVLRREHAVCHRT